MKSILLKNKRIVLITFILSILSSFTNVTAGYLLSYLYKGISNNSLQTLISDGVILVVVWILALLSTYTKNIFQAKAIRNLNSTLRYDICDKITNLDYQEFYKMDSGNYVSWLTNDVNLINSLGFSQFFSIIESLFTLVFAFIALSMLHYSISLAALILSLFMFIIPKLTNKYLSQYSESVSMQQEKFVESTKETIMGYDIFNGFNLLSNIKKYINKYSNELEDTLYTFKIKQSLVHTLIGFTNITSQLGLLLLTAYLVINQFTPNGSILSVTNLGGTFFSALVNILNSYVALKTSKPIFKKFEYNKDNSSNNYNLLEFPEKINNVEVKKLEYSYNDNVILHDVNMTFEEGKKYAIVGESGSGKTTVIKILLGLLNDYKGEILINGINKDLYNNKNIIQHFIYIDQNIYLFNDTVRNNITLGRDYSDKEIYTSLKKSNLYDFINSKDEKLDMMIEENGKNLSGGQRQRIAISRALLSGKSFIIIDEGTSSIDEKNAMDIESALVDNPNLTTVFITHNLREDIKSKLDTIYTIDNLIASKT